MNNNNWLKSIAKTYIQLNENSDNPVSQRARDYPNENDMGGGPPGDPIGFRDLNNYMKREGIISHGFILPRDIEIHGSPFNEDGTINSDHRSVQNALETAQSHHGGKDRFKEFYAKLDAQREGRTIEDPLKRYLPYIRIIDRMVDGKQSGHFIQVMDKPQLPPQPPLNEARKMKPTATDSNKNRQIEREARLAHQQAATAITSVPGFKTHGKYSGMNSAEDPEHDNVTAHLAAVAPAVTDPKTAIQLVAKKHGVDPEAAIAALGSSAPMSPQDFMKAMRR